RELYSIRQFGEVRNAAEIRTIPAARQATRMWIRHVAWSRLRGNANELWPWRAILYKMIRYIRHQGQQPHRIRAIDLVPGVARLVIIGVQPGEKEQHRHLLRREGSMVARSVARLLAQIRVEIMLGRKLFQQR